MSVLSLFESKTAQKRSQRLEKKRKRPHEKTHHDRCYQGLQQPRCVVIYSPVLGQRWVRQTRLGVSKARQFSRFRISDCCDQPHLVGDEVEALGVIAELKIDCLAVEPLLCGGVSAVDIIRVGARRSRDFNGQKVLQQRRAERRSLSCTIDKYYKTRV